MLGNKLCTLNSAILSCMGNMLTNSCFFLEVRISALCWLVFFDFFELVAQYFFLFVL